MSWDSIERLKTIMIPSSLKATMSDLTSVSSEPPPYTLRSRTPSYSYLPHADEEVIEHTPRSHSSSNAHAGGNFVRNWHQGTLVLKNQDPDARLPTYGRHGTVIGELGLVNSAKVLEVTLKFQGHLSLSGSDGVGSVELPLVSQTATLWRSDDKTEHRCPSLLPFAVQFPTTYQAEGRTWRLPPSFEATFIGVPALFARSTYFIRITISRSMQYRVASWTTSKSFTTLLLYKPRNRPSRPLLRYGSVFSFIKPAPEEWLQIISTMEVRKNSKHKPIDCHFVVPSVQTFALSESIPFHLQLSSSLETISDLFPPNCPLLKPKDAPGEGEKRLGLVYDGLGAFIIRVYIARQVSIEINGRKRVRTSVIGNGALRPVPPTVSWQGPGDDVSVDWEGEVKCFGEVTTGGFSTSNLVVNDFLVVALTPSSARTSPLLPMHVSHPIKLVTDPWSEESMHPHDT